MNVQACLYFLLLFFCTATSPVKGQNITFGHLTTDEELSHFSVNSLYLDEHDLLWIGTREGLNRYNGNHIHTYKLQKDDPNSLFCNNVLRITGNREGKIYLLCTDGVAEFDLRYQQFRTLLLGNISTIYFNKRLYISIRNEIYIYNEATRNFDFYYQLPRKDISITALHLDDKGYLWLGTSNSGVYKVSGRKELQQLLPKGKITHIYQDSTGELWIGTWEHGLFHIDREGQVTNLLHRSGDPASISSNFVTMCCEDDLGDIWIGTFSGLNQYRRGEGVVNTYVARKDRPKGLIHSSIWCIVKDAQGTILLGTYFGGVNFFNPAYEIYTHHRESDVEANGLSSPVVGCMLEDKHGNLWICTEGGGINVYERDRRRFRWYLPGKGPDGLSESSVKSIWYDEKNEVMWFGTHLGGLNRLDLKTDRFTQFPNKDGDLNILPSDIVQDIVPWRGQLILATQEGVTLFDPQTGIFRRMFIDKREGRSIHMVSDLQIDREGTLWMAVAGEGVFAYRFDTDSLVNYRYHPHVPGCISNNNINSILEDSRGNLWFSTSGTGLDRYLRATNSFENFDSRNNGLSSDCVYEMCESSTTGHYLLITDQGFSLFDHPRKEFINYSKENGFPLTAVNENALYMTRDGEVFLGGVQGMISFYEKKLRFTPKAYNIMLASLKVNGREIVPGDNTGILRQDISYTTEIELPAGHSMLTIEFATSNYISANKEPLVYRLEGFSDDWNRIREPDAITYTNLSPGRYRLVIRPAQVDSLAQECRLDILVPPPFYRSLWAYLIYIVILGTAGWILLRTYNSRIRLQESLKYEQKHLQDVEALNQSKLRFFTNISHEFRTPLTLIVGQVEALMQGQSFTPQVYQKILRIYKNSLQLKELISELLDFRKQEQGHMKIRVAQHDLVKFLYENYLLFQEYSQLRQIDFVFHKEVYALLVWYDSRQMQKVVNNLLSNALKHTPLGGSIILSVYRKGNEAVVEVTNTGPGIRKDDLPYIFDRFYQTKESEALGKGTGLGLALTRGIVELHGGQVLVQSDPEQGSTFRVVLKLGNQHFLPEQIDQQEQQSENLYQEDSELKVFEPEEDVADSLGEIFLGRRISNAIILIVEDNESIRHMLCDVFRTYYHVISASNGEEAWGLVVKESPHIVLSDVVMPCMSGMELCRKIKSDPETCHIPVVLLTARTTTEHNLEGLRMGADDYITKPFNINLLVSRCNNLVNSRIILQEKFSRQPQMFAQTLATNPIDKELLDRATEIIEKHLDDTEFSVSVFAQQMGMARTSLFCKLKGITGQTPNDFILSLRLKKGAYLLRNQPKLNVTEIADRTGFSSPRYFSKCFKDAYHVNPLAYRRGEEPEGSDEK